MTISRGRPTWLLDIDGVLNADAHRPPPGDLWARRDWHRVRVYSTTDNTTYELLYAQPVVDAINRIHTAGLADIVWHTSWQHDAHRVAARLGLHYDPGFAVLDAPELHTWRHGRASGWWKVPAVRRWAHTHPHTPLVWTDDEAGRRLDPRDRAELLITRPTLVVSPNGRGGLGPVELAGIETFLHAYTPRPAVEARPALTPAA